MASGSDYLSAGFIGRHAGAGFVEGVVEIFHIHARAWAAAHHYERLNRFSETDLAKLGLRRVDLPRAAFHILIEHAWLGMPTEDELSHRFPAAPLMKSSRY